MATGFKAIDNPNDISSTANLGMLLIQQYTVVFELLGVLLLIALIGAASMARR